MKSYQRPEALFMPLPNDILTASVSISQPYGEDKKEWGNP